MHIYKELLIHSWRVFASTSSSAVRNGDGGGVGGGGVGGGGVGGGGVGGDPTLK